MKHWILVMEIMIQAALYTGPLVIIVLLSHARRKNVNNAFLALSLLCIWYGLLMTRLIISREILQYPALIRTGNIGGYLIFPFLYVYVRNTFYPGCLWRNADLLLFIPALVYIVDMLPFFLSPADEKAAIFRESISNLEKLYRVSEGWIPINGLHFVLRYLFAFLIQVLIIIMIVRNRNNQAHQSSAQMNKPFYFMVLLIVLYSPTMFPGIFGVLFHARWYTLQFLELSFTLSMIGVIVFLVYSPDVLYGYLKSLQFAQPTEVPLLVKSDTLGEKPITDSRHSKDESAHVDQILVKVERYLEEYRPFLKPGFSIRDLSKEISVPVYQISYIINHKYNRHFSNWLNYHRIEYFLELARRDENKNITLEALAMEAGFSNRITFINAFKREKGISPSTFLKSSNGQRLSVPSSM